MALSLETALYVAKLRCKLTFPDYRILAEWLDCYHYILPNNRANLTDLGIATIKLYSAHKKPNPLSEAYFSLISVDTLLTIEQQKEVTEWINDYLISVTADCCYYTPVPGDSNSLD